MIYITGDIHRGFYRLHDIEKNIKIIKKYKNNKKYSIISLRRCLYEILH